MKAFYSSAGVTGRDYMTLVRCEDNVHITFTFSQRLAVAFLFLLFHLYNVVGRNPLQEANLILNHLDDVSADIALNDDLVQPLWVLRHRGSARELGGEEFCGFL